MAIDYFPVQPIFYLYVGIAYKIREDYTKALDFLERGNPLSIDSKLEGQFNAQLGDIYFNIDEYEKSYSSYERALLLDPNDLYVLNNYSYFLSLRKENLDKAKKMARRLILLSPDNSSYLDTYGWVLYANEEFEEAKIQIEKALQDNENGGYY